MSVLEKIQKLSQVTREKGALVPQSLAAKLLNVSNQRVGQLIDLGKLEAYEVDNTRFVFEKSLVAFAQTERKVGRPVKTSYTMGEMWKMTHDDTKEVFSDKK